MVKGYKKRAHYFFSFWINWRQVLNNVKINRLKDVAIFSEIIWTWLWNSATILEIVMKIRCKSFRSSEFTLSEKLKNRFYGRIFWPTRYRIFHMVHEVIAQTSNLHELPRESLHFSTESPVPQPKMLKINWTTLLSNHQTRNSCLISLSCCLYYRNSFFNSFPFFNWQPFILLCFTTPRGD